MSSVGLWNSLAYPIGMHDITCSGTESSITDCQYSIIPNRICYSNDAVGVFCQESKLIINYHGHVIISIRSQLLLKVLLIALMEMYDY